jgi:hypothetical protein
VCAMFSGGAAALAVSASEYAAFHLSKAVLPLVKPWEHLLQAQARPYVQFVAGRLLKLEFDASSARLLVTIQPHSVPPLAASADLLFIIIIMWRLFLRRKNVRSLRFDAHARLLCR